MSRTFLIVLDSFGIGAMPDAESFGDNGANTLKSCVNTGILEIPNLLSLGLGNIDGVDCLPKANPIAAYCRMGEASRGKDTTVGHWELAGVISQKPLPVYPNGFPEEILAPFRAYTGREILANAPWSGTEVIEAYGKTHMETGALIVYTSADSVFQIAAHEDIVPVETLYDYCRFARRITSVGRVIARPFVGTPGNFKRTANRHDFSLMPPEDTLLDKVKASGKDCIGIGKIHDIFAGRGLTEHVYTQSNLDGMEKTAQMAERSFDGLCMVNLVDFDMQYGHRRDVNGYTRALNEFDAWLGGFLPKLKDDDLLLITADHGCDPGFMSSTDHTREYVPLLIYAPTITPANLGTKESFTFVAETVQRFLGI